MTKREVFSRIARRYDRVNWILSFGRDGAWRRSAIAHLPRGVVVDLGAGTGAANPDLGERTIVAVDPAREMLALNSTALRVVGKGEALPFADGSVNGVFSAYVFRNLESIATTLAEIDRVLHRSLDSLPQPQVIYADSPLAVDRIWRMGPFGFVYGVVLRKAGGER